MPKLNPKGTTGLRWGHGKQYSPGNVTQAGQEDVDEEIGAASNLEEDSERLWVSNGVGTNQRETGISESEHRATHRKDDREDDLDNVRAGCRGQYEVEDMEWLDGWYVLAGMVDGWWDERMKKWKSHPVGIYLYARTESGGEQGRGRWEALGQGQWEAAQGGYGEENRWQ